MLTDNSIDTPRDLGARLLGSGIDVPEHARCSDRRLGVGRGQTD